MSINILIIFADVYYAIIYINYFSVNILCSSIYILIYRAVINIMRTHKDDARYIY